ncbi:reverse transcriptase domain-containing protein [Tanacetum coccineum]|uniref:Reverse transcriptase domain-containing protein n=1 Tax=Tanacetum coccineum TaxID=301880 RepID=A0ABQ5C7F6_9ASTR
MVKEGIILGHKVSGLGIEVDKEKIESISKLPYPTNVKAVRSFLGHANFYRRFIKDFSQVARPMTQLLVKDAPFNFSEECIQAFDKLKRELTQAPIMIKPDWSLQFEIMCDASDYTVRVVLGQKKDKHFQPIYYASKMMNEAQENYTTTEKELLAVIFSFDKFRQYLVLSITIEFDIEIRDKKGTENLTADHLSRLENPDLRKLTRAEIRHLFPEEQLMTISDRSNEPWMNPFYSNSALTRSYGGVWPGTRLPRFFDNNGNKYILVAIDYVSKWVEDQVFPASDARNVVNFLKKLFAHFGITKALISDRGTHFCNYQMERAMKKYGVVHRFSTAYHPQINGQLKSRWYGPFTVTKDMKNRAIELCDEEGNEFIVNKQRVKPYQKEALDFDADDDITLEDEGGVT